MEDGKIQINISEFNPVEMIDNILAKMEMRLTKFKIGIFKDYP